MSRQRRGFGTFVAISAIAVVLPTVLAVASISSDARRAAEQEIWRVRLRWASHSCVARSMEAVGAGTRVGDTSAESPLPGFEGSVAGCEVAVLDNPSDLAEFFGAQRADLLHFVVGLCAVPSGASGGDERDPAQLPSRHCALRLLATRVAYADARVPPVTRLSAFHAGPGGGRVLWDVVVD